MYRTYLEEQEVQLSIAFKLWHHQHTLREVSVGECRSLRIRYLNFKERKEKHIDILHGKGILLNAAELNNKLLYNLIQEAKALKETSRNNLHVDLLAAPLHFRLLLKNETPKRVKLNLGGSWVLSTLPHQEEELVVDFEDYLQLLSNPRSYL